MKSRDLLLERKTNNGMHKQKQIQLWTGTRLYTVINKEWTEEMGHSAVYFPRR